jgi:hypothetical protein
MATPSSKDQRQALTAADRTDPRPEPSPLSENSPDRAQLEAARDILVDRLHRRSDDFEATRELRGVNSKLQRTSYGTQVVTASS